MINYYWISIQGKNPKQLLNTLIKERISMIAIKYEKDRILIKVTYDEYKKIKSIKTIYEIKIVKTVGRHRFEQLYQRNQISIFALVISVFFIIFMSNLILGINIETDNNKLKKEIVKELNKNNITLFTLKKDYNSYKKISNRIRNNNLDKIEWLEFEQKGVFLNIKVIERVNKKIKENFEYKDIIASKNGYIRKIYSRRGELMKNIDDYVNKGEVIISGNIFRNKKVIGKVRAEGKVYAEVWYIVNLNQNLYYKGIEEKEFGREVLQLKINNYNINFFSFPKKVSIYKKKSLFKNNSFELSLIKEKKYIFKNKKYNETDLQSILEMKAKKEIMKTLEKDEYIMLQKTLKKSTKNDRMYIEVFFKVYEDIALEKDLQKIEEKKDE